MQVETRTFTQDDNLNPAERFSESIGLVYSEHPVENVILSFSPIQGKYIKTLPMHSSQTVLIDNDDECLILLRVAPNFELRQQILKHGDAVKVIEPECWPMISKRCYRIRWGGIDTNLTCRIKQAKSSPHKHNYKTAVILFCCRNIETILSLFWPHQRFCYCQR